MSDPIDRSRPVRAGEQLDLGRLVPFLAGVIDLGPGEVEVEQFPGGHSNLTYLLRVGTRELVLRRPPFGSQVATAHDMRREYLVLEALAPHFPPAPRPIAFCDDPSILGADFYLMERVPGVILRRRPPAGLSLGPALAEALCRSLVTTLFDLHALDYRAIGLGDFGRPEGYVERQVSGWTRRYRGSQTDEIPGVEEVATWLASHLPTSQRAAIIHNDLKFDNLVLDPADLTRVVGVLDWEMTTIGDPLMDLGTSLSYWVEVGDPQPVQMLAFGPTGAPGMMTRRQLVDAYAEKSGLDVGAMVFYFAYGLFKTAVVAQQIYYRYHQGLTQDARFAAFIAAVRILIDQARRAIDADAI